KSVVSLVTMKAVMPRVFLAAGSVRAVTTKISPTPACVMKILEPFNTKWSPLSTATDWVPPASDPAPGSVRPNPPSTFPAASSGTKRRFCSSVPKSTIGDVPSVVRLAGRPKPLRYAVDRQQQRRPGVFLPGAIAAQQLDLLPAHLIEQRQAALEPPPELGEASREVARSYEPADHIAGAVILVGY